MKRLTVITLAAGILTASCSGHGNQSLLPPAPNGGAAQSDAQMRQPAVVAPAGWAATATRGLKLAQGADVGPLSASKILTVRVGLQLHDTAQLQRAIEAREKVSHAHFMSQFAPTQAEAASVVTYLQKQGLTHVSASPDRLLVSATGTAANVRKAFNTTIDSFTLRGAPVYLNTKPALVPAALGGIVKAVLGLNNAATMRFAPSPCFPIDPAPAPTPCLRNYGPQEIQKFYDTGTMSDGSETTIAVMAEGDVSQTVADLRYAETATGLPQVPVTVVPVGMPSADTAGVIEWDLDSQSSTGIANNVKALYIYDTTSLTDSDIANEYSHWVTDDKAQLGNSSFGECEHSAFLDGAMAVDDEILMEGAAQGQTMFASTGDNGSACAIVPANGAPASGAPMVNYPASSPWVVGVGGTTLASNNDDTYVGETVWNAGGGGVSQFENSPRYMQRVQVVGATVAEANLRGLPDVAMAGDPNAGGYLVYTATPLQTTTGACPNPCAIGGTSESSPLAMGSYARLQSAHANVLGFAGPQLYNIYIENPTATSTVTGPPPTQVIGGYHDILTGSNGAYTALPSYDYGSGMGSLDISLTNQFIGH